MFGIDHAEKIGEKKKEYDEVSPWPICSSKTSFNPIPLGGGGGGGICPPSDCLLYNFH